MLKGKLGQAEKASHRIKQKKKKERRKGKERRMRTRYGESQKCGEEEDEDIEKNE